jgi:hypothetical protein
MGGAEQGEWPVAVVGLNEDGAPLSAGPAPCFDSAAIAERFRLTRADPASFELVPVRRLAGELAAPVAWFEGEAALWWDGSEGRGLVGPWVRLRWRVPGVDPEPELPRSSEVGLYRIGAGRSPAAVAFHLEGSSRRSVEAGLLHWRAERLGRRLPGTEPMPDGVRYVPPYPPPGAWVVGGAPTPG